MESKVMEVSNTEEKLLRMSDLTYDRGWTRRMIDRTVPDKVVEKNKSKHRFWSMDTVLEAERKFSHVPQKRPRPPKKERKKPSPYRSKPESRTPIPETLGASIASKSITACPPGVQRRVVHLQTLVPFYAPAILGRSAVSDYNLHAARARRPVVSLSDTDQRLIDRIKVRFLERRVIQKAPNADRAEILKAIQLVYPYLSGPVSDMIEAVHRDPSRRRTA